MGFFNKRDKEIRADFSKDLVGCFGKLPFQAEFIKLQWAVPEVQTLDRVMQDSYAHINRRQQETAKDQFQDMPLYYFCHYKNAILQPIAGVIMPSTDISGRQYPFVMTRVINNPLICETPSILPLLYKNYFWAASIFCQTMSELTSITELQAKLKPLKPEQDPADGVVFKTILHQLGQTHLMAFWQGVVEDYAGLTLPHFIQTIADGLDWARERTRRSQAWVLAVPLPHPIEPTLTTTFWLQLIDALLPQTKVKLQCYWNLAQGAYRPTLFLFHEMPASTLLSYLIEPNQNSDSLFHVIDEAKKHPDIEVSTTALIDAVDENLLQVLDRWSHTWM